LNNIQLNIVANAQFQQVYAEVAKLRTALTSLQQTSVGGPFTASVQSDIKAAQAQFDSAVLSTRAFTIQQVAMTDSVSKFGQQLSRGQLSLQNYYKIWRDSAKGTSAEIDALATAQARLNRSMAIADPLKPGYAKLVTDINGVVTAEEKAVFQQQALNTALQQGSIKLIDFGKNTQWMGRQLTVGLTMPLAMFGAAASQAYLSFDKQMTQMLQVYGAHAVVQSQATLDLIQKQVTSLADKLARTLGVAMTDTVQVAQTFSSIGLEGQNLIAATEATVRLQKLGNLTAQQASTSMVALQNVFHLQSSQMLDAVNFLNAAKHSTSTTMQDIVDALPRVGPIIQQLGGSYKDFATMLVALKESGIPAAQGANAIKSMLASMINPTKAASTALSALHINLKQIVATNTNNPMGMVQGLASALNQLPSSERLKAIEQVFGKFQFARVTALLNNLSSSTSQASKVIALYNDSSSQLASVANQELQVSSSGTPAAQFQKMKATLQADLLPLGRSFLQAFTQIGNAVDHIYNAIKGLANALGPVASVFGKIFGTGFAGLIIVGPIIMLVGLFANLIGNVMRGANAIRMFKQGMADAIPGQNAFMAGVKGMRNFYQELDAAEIAARNQMDLMPEAITSNAKAFQILRNELALLTDQFKLLASAQLAANSQGLLSAIGTVLPKEGSTLLKIVPKNKGGFLPGFNTGGPLYDPSKHGSIVPGPSNVNYDSVLASVPVGGFVLNKAASQRNPGLARLPKFSGGGKMLAMLTPGETVFDPATTAANYSMLNAANNGDSIGGAISSGKSDYGSPEEMAALVRKLARENKLPSSVAEKATKEIKQVGLRGWLQDAKIIQATGTYAAKTILRDEALLKGYVTEKTTAEVVDTTSPWGIKLSKDQVDKVEGYKSANAVNSALEANSMDGTAFAKMIKSTNGRVSGSFDSFIDILVKSGKISFTKAEELKNNISNRYLESITGRVIGDSNNPYADVVLNEMSDLLKKDPEVANAFVKFSDSMPVIRKGSLKRKTYVRSNGKPGVQGRGSSYKDVVVTLSGSNYTIPSDNFKGVGNQMFLHTTQPAWAGVQGYAKGGAIGAHHRHSPVYSYTGSDVYRGQTRKMKASLGVHYNSYKAPHTKGLKGWNSGGVLGGLINTSKPNYGMLGTSGQTLSSLKNLWRYGAISRQVSTEVGAASTAAAETGALDSAKAVAADTTWMSKVTSIFKVGFISKLGPLLKFSLIQFLPTIFDHLVPNKVAGKDLSGAKSVISGGLSAGTLAFAFGAAPEIAVPIGIAVAAFKGFSWWMNKNKKDAADHAATIQKLFSGNSQTIAFFNNELSKTPKILAQDIGKLSSTDQTKQVANYIKSLSSGQAIGALNTYVSSQVMSGMDPSKVKDMVTAILTYTGQTNLLDTALKQIVADNKDLSTSTSTYIQKLSDGASQTDKYATAYKDLSLSGQNYASGLYNIVKAIQSGSLAGSRLTSVIDGLTSDTGNAAEQMNLLKLAAQNTGDTTMVTLISQIQTVISDAGKAKMALGEISGLSSLGVDYMAIINDNAQNPGDLEKILAGGKNKAGKTLEDYVKSQRQAALDKYNAAQKTANAGANATVDLNKQLTNLKEQKKTLDDQIKAMETKNNLIKIQNDYLNKQTDLTNQIKQAEITGNYIQAAQLTQQQQQNTAQYSSDTQLTVLKAKSDTMQGNIDALTATIAQVGTAAQAAADAAASLASFGKILTETLPALITDVKDLILQYLGKTPPDYKKVTPGPKAPTVRSGGMQTVNDPGSAEIITGPTVSKYTGQPIANPNHFYLMKYGNKYYGVNTVSSDDIRSVTYVDGKWVVGDPVQGIQNQQLTPVPPVKKASGGYIRRFDDGGGVRGPGTGTSDSIPAYLSNGEYVVKASAVNQYGVGLFDALNAQKFAGGGMPNPISFGFTQVGKGISAAALSFLKNIKEMSGISPTARVLSGHTDSNWDYLGMAALLAGPAKAIGMLPRAISGSIELADAIQFMFEKKAQGFAGGTPGGLKVPNMPTYADSTVINNSGTVNGYSDLHSYTPFDATIVDPKKQSAWSKGIHSYYKNFVNPSSKLMFGPAANLFSGLSDSVANLYGGDARWNDITNIASYLGPEALKGISSIGKAGEAFKAVKTFLQDFKAPAVYDSFKASQGFSAGYKSGTSQLGFIQNLSGLKKQASIMGPLETKFKDTLELINGTWYYKGKANAIPQEGDPLYNDVMKWYDAKYNTDTTGALQKNAKNAYYFNSILGAKASKINKFLLGKYTDLVLPKLLNSSLGTSKFGPKLVDTYATLMGKNNPFEIFDKVLSETSAQEAILKTIYHGGILPKIQNRVLQDGVSIKLGGKTIGGNPFINPQQNWGGLDLFATDNTNVAQSYFEKNGEGSSLYELLLNQKNIKAIDIRNGLPSLAKSNPQFLKSYINELLKSGNKEKAMQMLLQEGGSYARNLGVSGSRLGSFATDQTTAKAMLESGLNSILHSGGTTGLNLINEYHNALAMLDPENTVFGTKVINKALGGFINSKLPSFKVGINNVPYDMIAQIHKGERIVPADQNHSGFGGDVNVYVNATGVTDPKAIVQMAEEGVIKALNIKNAKINRTNMAVRI